MPISEDQVTELYGEGARIHSVHHRPRPEQSVFASSMSSNASVDTTVGSTAALIHSHAAKVKKKKYAFLRQSNHHNSQQAATNNGYMSGRHCRDIGLHHGQKELNLLLASPTVPNFIDQMRKKKQAIDQVSAKRLSSDDEDYDEEDDDMFQDLKTAAKIRTPQNTYVPQVRRIFVNRLLQHYCTVLHGYMDSYIVTT